MQGFKVTSIQDLTDWNALLREVASRAQDPSRRTDPTYLRWIPPILGIAVVAILVGAARIWPGLLNLSSMFVAIAVFAGVAYVAAWRQRRAFLPAEDGAFLGETTFVFEPEGFEAMRAHSRSRNQWGLIRDLSRTPTHIYLWIDHMTAYSFRISNLPAPMTGDEAFARLREYIAIARAKASFRASETPPESATPAPAPANTLQATVSATPTVTQELRALLRLAFHRPVEGNQLHGHEISILALALCAIGAWIGLDRLNYPANATFMWFALPSMSAAVLATLLIAWLLGRLSSPRVPMRQALLILLAGAPVVIAALQFAPRAGAIACLAIAVCVGIWAASLIHAGLRNVTGAWQGRAVFGTTALALLLVASSEFIFFSPGLWYAPDPDYDLSSETGSANEQILFDQSSRIDADIAKMAPAAAQEESAYFVGFAGYGGQRVFAEEIRTAANAIASRYSTSQRQLFLVNDRRDQEKYPLASVPALRHALLGVGKRMDRERDVLFLALSSHGSEDATISVSNEAMMYWHDLSAPDLRAMLDEAGIRWRVIIVSACHSGSFIESLADDQTIVLTAAAKENASFGCADDRDLTYFGEAFYRDALPKSENLRAAFDAARAAIADREKSEGRKPSDPQAHFGALIERKLATRQRVSTR